jgi:glycosyltransferase involved in cell wall biosynthesis
MTPDVSVVIPTHDRWPLVARSVDSALAQEGVSVEVIAVDDGSSDATAAELGARGDPRLRVLRHQAAQGPAGARNSGMAVARGDWIAWLDDDDVWAPDKLRAQLGAAEREQADFVYCDAVLVDREGRVLGMERGPEPGSFAEQIRVHNVMPGGCSNLVARAGAVQRAGSFDPQLRVLADWDYWIRLAASGRPAAVHRPLVAYLLHESNMVVRDLGDVLAELETLQDKHPGAELDVVSYCDWVAGGLRRGGRRWAAVRLFLRAARRYRSLKGLELAARVALGDWAVELPRSRRRQPVGAPEWLRRA